MEQIKALCIKYKDILLYGIFGVCTTIVNIISFYILSELALFPKAINTVTNTWIAWFLSVIFAYITNRKWVFESKACGKKEIFSEMGAFFACRIATGVMDAVIMYVFVDVLLFNNMLIKILSNVLVIVLNYVASKLYIFKDKKIKDDIK